MKWSNELPAREGWYFYHRKEWIDGKLVRGGDSYIDVIYLSLNKDGSIEIIGAGEECTETIRKPIVKYRRPRDLSFSWTPKEERERNQKDLIECQISHWFHEVEFPTEPIPGRGEV